jgi:hypothetical protein
VSCRVVSCRVVSCRVVSCRVVSCRVVSCRVVSRRVASCRVECEPTPHALAVRAAMGHCWAGAVSKVRCSLPLVSMVVSATRERDVLCPRPCTSCLFAALVVPSTRVQTRVCWCLTNRIRRYGNALCRRHRPTHSRWRLVLAAASITGKRSLLC